ncbi:MAG TPA: hypothetical protein VJ438_05165 [Candidatus Nanoarchaeia archaeon]|nr:hypothetical protein [Candidatus Nanoarchaeia archaeon]
MINRDMSVFEIKKDLEGKGDFVQLDHLNRLLNHRTSDDVRRFAYSKIAEIYEKKGMYTDAAKMCHNLAIISVAFSEKKRYHLKESELYIKEGKLERANEAMKKAMTEANAPERAEIYATVKEFYRKEAEISIIKKRKNNAVKIYEKLLEMDISGVERKEIKKKLLGLYENLGKIKEYMVLKREFEKL